MGHTFKIEILFRTLIEEVHLHKTTKGRALQINDEDQNNEDDVRNENHRKNEDSLKNKDDLKN